MAQELDLVCKPCNQPYTITAESAVHDDNLIDVVVSCSGCGHTLNAFISIDEMTDISEGSDHDR